MIIPKLNYHALNIIKVCIENNTPVMFPVKTKDEVLAFYEFITKFVNHGSYSHKVFDDYKPVVKQRKLVPQNLDEQLVFFIYDNMCETLTSAEADERLAGNPHTIMIPQVTFDEIPDYGKKFEVKFELIDIESNLVTITLYAKDVESACDRLFYMIEQGGFGGCFVKPKVFLPGLNRVINIETVESDLVNHFCPFVQTPTKEDKE